MIPSAVAREARENLLDYLATTYGLSDEALERALLAYLSGPEGIFRGPFVDVRLPFRQASSSAPMPLEVRPEFRPWKHQMRAFERLHARPGHQPQPTLVTTGTGSGKTECFLFPILDHCLREREADRGGIKAILLYPMNALATDQARRIAKQIWDDPRLKNKVTAGLYVGGKGSHAVPSREHLVDKREELRQSPPDILLTNYKMLDFLLLRPEDQRLWRDNGPDTLRYLVLDELHTYDGAQGSDVACLIRRLRARLEAREGAVCCVGTSATIGEGDEESKQRLTSFAREIFDQDFYLDSVITEERIDADELLAGEGAWAAEGSLDEERPADRYPQIEDLARLDPALRPSADWLSDQRALWFGEEARGWSGAELGDGLLGHGFLRSLLRALGGRPVEAASLVEKLARRERWLAEFDPEGRLAVLDSFLGLISQARRRSASSGDGVESERPFLQVQLQLWLREVRGLLRAVAPEPRFRWRSEPLGRGATATDGARWLPMARCGDCGAAGFASVEAGGDGRLADDAAPGSIGGAWMARDPKARFVMLGHGPPKVDQAEFVEYLCPRCLGLGLDSSCGCSGAELPTLPVRVAREQTHDKFARFRPVCPECGGEDTLMFIGSRAASLLSVSISHLYQTDHNTDRKLLAFVDSVQDASHRAGFFGARTYRFNLRGLIQELIGASGGRLPLVGVGEQLIAHAEQRFGGLREAVPVLVPEDLRGHPDHERFLESEGRELPRGMRHWLAERLALEVTFEFGYAVRQGRSLEQTGSATLELDRAAVATAVDELATIVGEDGLLDAGRGAPSREHLAVLVDGLLDRLRLRGGVRHPLLDSYAASLGNRWMLSRRQNPLMPIFAPDAVLPRFLLERAPRESRRSAFDAYGGDGKTWFRDYAARVLDVDDTSPEVVLLYRYALERLHAAGVVWRGQGAKDRRAVWGLDPSAASVVEGVRELVCDTCREPVRVAPERAEARAGQVCPRYRCPGRLGEPRTVAETFYTRLFKAGKVARVFPEEHTGLLDRQARERIEERFKSGRFPDGPNLLVCTPTLEMGIDIGDLSAVLMCAVPPTTSMYLQRIGRAGRTTGNALCLTMATARPHDLYFHAEPVRMMAGAVDPPGCFLDAPSMLERQVVAFGMDRWAVQERELERIPPQTTAVLAEGSLFPRRFLEFWAEHKHDLLADFLARFESHTLSASAREQLERFALSERLPERVRGAFDEVRVERDRLKRLQARARKRLEELERDTDLSPEERERERQETEEGHRVLGRLITELGKRYPLNVMTDAGVLPNYAFPEPGVELESVVRVDERGKRRYVPHSYQRPASAAIRELAPFNTFYAEGRRVRVDEIDLGTTANPLIESWRLCAACAHLERDESGAPPASACPACGDPDWADVKRRRELVWFRRSRSLSTRLEAAMADDGDERHRERYTTLDLIAAKQGQSRGARLVEALPFGFELFERLKLREVNFGPDTGGAGRFAVDGQVVGEDGFRVCRDCGRVRGPRPQDKLEHAPTCGTRKGRPERIESMYLYREVESEAIRILLPVVAVDLETRRASFKAALELGLRARYGGRVPHLAVKSMREPIRGGGQRTFLVLFDTVPGGTGFLADLWRDDALVDVLRLALDRLEACSCHKDQADGCYRCLYAWQNQRELELTSKKVAIELLREIVAARSGLVDALSLSDVAMESRLESELEEHFLTALQGYVSKRGSWRQRLRNGKAVYEFSIQARHWELEPQVQLGQSQGVWDPSRPDFLIRPTSIDGDRREVAVFCDGLAYHVEPDKPMSRLADDVGKRRALLDSGRYLVWSVTWADVVDFAAGQHRGAPSLLNSNRSDPGQKVLEKWGLTPELDLACMNSVRALVEWLSRPDERRWLERIASLGVALTVQAGVLDAASIAAAASSLGAPEAEPPAELATEPASAACNDFARFKPEGAAALLARLPTAALRGGAATLPTWNLRLYDDQERRAAKHFEVAWRAFLHAINLLQFQFGAGFDFSSTQDLKRRAASGADLYPATSAHEGLRLVAESPASSAEQHPEPSELDSLELLDEERVLVEATLAAGLELPVPGFELVAANHRVIATASLAWPGRTIAVLLGASREDGPAFERLGWHVLADPEPRDLIHALREREPQEKEG